MGIWFCSPGRRTFSVLILATAFTVVCAVGTPASAGMPVPGKPVPDFVLPRLLNGKAVALEDLRGKVVLLNIWASWCTACKDEMEDLMTVREQYGPRGFVLLSVNIDNAPTAATDFLARLEARTKRNTGFLVLYDRDKKVPKEYRQRAMPTSYLIDRAGIVRKIFPGSFSDTTLPLLRAAIEEALK